MTLQTAKPTLPRMSSPHYEPKIGDTITLELPDERTRATVEKVVSDTAVLARLQHFTTSKSHSYRKGDVVPCRFGMLDMTIPGWKVVSQRELEESAVARENRVSPKKPKAPAAKAKAKKKR